MGTFYLKYRDTRPVLEVSLKNPDGTAHDLTSSTGWKLHIKLTNGVTVSKAMSVYSASGGVLRYTWSSTDWAAGGLIPGTGHRMEYEVINGTARLTFPNNGFDSLDISADLGQG